MEKINHARKMKRNKDMESNSLTKWEYSDFVRNSFFQAKLGLMGRPLLLSDSFSMSTSSEFN